MTPIAEVSSGTLAAGGDDSPLQSAVPVGQSHWTSLRFLSIARLLVIALVLGFVLLQSGAEAVLQEVDREGFLAVGFGYLAIAIGLLIPLRLRRPSAAFQPLLISQALIDLMALTALMYFAGGVRSGMGVLLIGAVAAASVLSQRRMALFLAASATLLMLVAEFFHGLSIGSLETGPMLQTGLTGLACFGVALAVSWLAMRLATQEALAVRRGEDLRLQMAINRLVIAELPQAVLVVDAAGQTRTMNPSARRLLASLDGADPVQGMVRARHTPGGELELLAAARGGTRRLRVRHLAPEAEQASGDSVLVVEDMRELEQRARQLKLAAMGRLSASIAHEIRNPLAAIRHANQLLAERPQDALAQRLSRIIEDNSVRIDRIVEDVLAIARRDQTPAQFLPLASLLPTLVAEVCAEHEIDPARVRTVIASDAPLRFDPHQFRQVMSNLISNAARYASGEQAAIRVSWRAGQEDRLELTIADDGLGIAPELQDHVFEPFFTSEPRGSGLGLYLVREFCDANGASVHYEWRDAEPSHRSVFVIRPAQSP